MSILFISVEFHFHLCQIDDKSNFSKSLSTQRRWHVVPSILFTIYSNDRTNVIYNIVVNSTVAIVGNISERILFPPFSSISTERVRLPVLVAELRNFHSTSCRKKFQIQEAIDFLGDSGKRTADDDDEIYFVVVNNMSVFALCIRA